MGDEDERVSVWGNDVRGECEMREGGMVERGIIHSDQSTDEHIH